MASMTESQELLAPQINSSWIPTQSIYMHYDWANGVTMNSSWIPTPQSIYMNSDWANEDYSTLYPVCYSTMYLIYEYYVCSTIPNNYPIHGYTIETNSIL